MSKLEGASERAREAAQQGRRAMMRPIEGARGVGQGTRQLESVEEVEENRATSQYGGPGVSER
jgi:hypothetical protein